MTPAEKIAEDTWERLKLSRGLKVRLGRGDADRFTRYGFRAFDKGSRQAISKY